MSQTDQDSETLLRCRRQIDAVNAQLLELLEARGRLVEVIAEVKRRRGTRIHDPGREDAMVASILARASGPFTHAQIESVFRRIFEISREIANSNQR